MLSATTAGLHPPRIYCINANALGQHDVWHALLTHVAAMHFDAILLSGSSALVLHAAESNNSCTTLESFCAASAQAGLRVLLDIEIDRFAPDHTLALQHPSHFFCEPRKEFALPDPRLHTQHNQSSHAQLRLDTNGTQLALNYWHTHLAQLIAAGISGFRCLGITRIAPAIWSALIAQEKTHRSDNSNTHFFAWTPGCTSEQLHALQPCGFDGVFSSDAWWDYHSSWLAEEHQRLSKLGIVIAAPEDPNGARLRCNLHTEESALAEAAYRRALLSAAGTGDGLLLTAGFEYGSDRQLEQTDSSSISDVGIMFDLASDITQINHVIASRQSASVIRLLSSPDADIALLLRGVTDSPHATATLFVINTHLTTTCTISGRMLRERASGWTLSERLNDDQSVLSDTSVPNINLGEDSTLTLAPGAVLCYIAQPSKKIHMTQAKGKQAILQATAAAALPRIAIENITPHVDGGRFAVKRIVGNTVNIEADIFGEGHDQLAAVVLWRTADEKGWQEVPMQLVTNDRWRGVLPLERVGRHLFLIEAWRDNFASYRDELGKKADAGLDITLELQEGRQYISKLIAQSETAREHVAALKELLKQLSTKSKLQSKIKNTLEDREDQATMLGLLLCTETAQLMRAADPRESKVRGSVQNAISDSIKNSAGYIIDVERKAAEFSSWYELFPRSQSGETTRHGNFDDVIARMPAVREMGFDTLYFPPIHPIGRKNMKGKNNSLTPGPDDPGSPYAIGSEAGGHDVIHPQLGTLDDFRRLVAAAQKNGLEIALDFAIQCSPDHPWLQQHPEWFAWRPDGSIRYAENPPKKYEDIVNVDFYAEDAIPDLWIALRDVVSFWVNEGVRVFRVDNPHTKPLPFWEWMIGDIRSRAPDTIFLAEAFTRPKPMYRLAKLGFSQSYTYFTWRHDKQEFIDYLTELSSEGPRDFFRPHFFVNTPDINPHFLQRSGRAGFVIRAALAATLSGLWGVYSGFELCEAQAMPGKEEYLDSEKYEIRAWDWQQPGNIVHEVTMLNRIRKSNPALQNHLDMQFHFSSSEHILYFSKSTRSAGQENQEDHQQDNQKFGDNVLLIAINLDPFAAHDAEIELPMWKFGLFDHAALQVEELMSESRFIWTGKHQRIHLDPQQIPFAIWRVRPYGNEA